MELLQSLVALNKLHKILVAKNNTLNQVMMAIAGKYDSHKIFTIQINLHGIVICDYFYD